MVSTIKFSQFTSGGDLSNGVTTVGLDGTLTINTRFNNPWSWLAPGTTGDRPPITSAIYYRQRFNTTLKVYEYYDPISATWVELSGSGTGTVNPGVTNDLAFYPANGTTLSPIAAAANAVLVTNAGSVPSLSTTLPTGLSIPSATITSSTAALTSGQVAAVPVNPTDITNKTYVDTLVGAGVSSITGTTNQVIANHPTGAVTLSLPQDIATGSSPTFSTMTLSSSTVHGLVVGEASSAFNYITPSATSGVPLISQGVSADPVYGTALVAGGGTGNTTFTAYSVICAGTTATGVFQNVSGLGSANQVLVSNGAGALPSWQAIPSSGAVTSITGTANQIAASASTGAVTLSIVSNPILPGTGGFTLPTGNTAARAGGAGTMRFNSQTTVFESTVDGSTWATIETSATGVVSVSGTTNRITSTGGTTPVIDIAATYVGQSSITTLGTITTGVWTGTNIALANGGTNASLTASNGGIFYSTASAGAILAGTATAGQMLQSGSSTTPAWSTSTYPATNAINTLLYASSANVMSALATANSGVLVTSAGGAPSFSSTLPAFTTSSITFNPTTGGIVGTTTNDNAAAGKVGEFISSIILAASSVTFSNNVVNDLTSISLTAGDWDVWGNIYAVGTTCQVLIGWISSVSATQPDHAYELVGLGTATTIASPVPYQRISIAGNTTIYISADITGTGTLTACGGIFARRVR